MNNKLQGKDLINIGIFITSKKEVVYTSLMMCENAPPEWLHVPEENIKRFQQSIRYKRADDKDAALEKFEITFQKQRLSVSYTHLYLWVDCDKKDEASVEQSLNTLISKSSHIKMDTFNNTAHIVSII